MIEILLTIGVVLLFLIWIRLAKVVLAIAALGGHLGRELEKLVESIGKLSSHLDTTDWRMEDIQERISDNFPTDDEKESARNALELT